MKIRRAKESDMTGINQLLLQVLTVHHNQRPDLFKGNTKKYTDKELKAVIEDDMKPIFVAVGEDETVLGYAFCQYIQHINDNILTDIKSLYIDDLCVDENIRGKHVGQKIYEKVKEFAELNNCYNITLNVWCCNPSAMKFYEKCGLIPQKIGMEMILRK